MPSIRIGLTTDFNLVGEQVGIGTTNPTVTLEVAGEIRTNNISVPSGVTTFTEYTGFLQPVQLISNTVSIAETTKGNLNSLSDEIKISGEVTIEPDVSVTGGRLDSLTVTDRFAVPLGETNNRDNTPEAGTTRFNQDLGTLEFFDGVNWKTVNSYSRGGAAGRGVFTGGYAANSQRMEYINISTQGNSINFGELFESSSFAAGKVSDGKRGVITGGRTSPANSFNGTMQYYTFASGGNSIDFGNQSANRRRVDSVSSSTRGIIAGGATSPGGVSDVIDYIEIQTLGNALDFGNLSDARYSPGGICNSTRGVFFGGGATDAEQRIIEYITISSKGDAVDFGECTQRSNCQGGGFSDGARGVLAGGYGVSGASSHLEQIEQINIASTGNSFDFGILHQTTRDFSGAQNMTRAVLATGRSGPTDLKNITQISLTTSGTSEDFGDLSYATMSTAGGSDSHGGLGGF